ncbi:MAG TPA: bi-domain-containing oxidoreductase [Blastocatellia bacterium]|jgi:predicted dehydrogenase|nr:bi-domain-containing oxidoreductase [Blastocatellia bacterium]
MKQVVQSFKTGALSVDDVPAPQVSSGAILVHTRASLVSAGTERMVVDFAEKNLLQKARSRPDLVRQTLDKVKREGILTTVEAVQNRLDKPVALGYSCAGVVLAAGSDATGFQAGDPVACAGAGFAVHAEVVSVPKNLAVKLPSNVDFESAAFTTLGAIALQGIRLAQVELRDVVAVIGLGLLGQLVVQMLKAAGCAVVGMDIQARRAELALESGADAVATNPDELHALCRRLSAGHGADAVLITADTKSNQPIELAGEIARDKGAVVAVGAVGLTIPRKVYYEKELDLRISRSYGPGRYDAEYEEKGHDYPYGYVRWTEQRNMQAFVELLSQQKVNVGRLISHRFQVDDARKAYELIQGKTGEPFLGVVLTYTDAPDLSKKKILRADKNERAEADGRGPSANLDQVKLGVIGAGLFANATLLPAIKGERLIKPVGVASGGGLSARDAADRHGFSYCTTDMQEILADPNVNTVAILTRHHLHARQVTAALEARKHVFVEKPLCLTGEELRQVIAAYEQARVGDVGGGGVHDRIRPMLMVGFNRRFAPFIVELKQRLDRVREPLLLHYRVNAGFIPKEHWTQDPEQGGGRLLGEACHFIDLLIHLAASAPVSVNARALPDAGRYSQDNLLVTLEFDNGSIGAVTYAAGGDKSFGKESLEVFGGGLSARLEDYRSLVISQAGKRAARAARLRQDKGHRAEWQAIIAHLTGGKAAPIPFEEILTSTRATLAAHGSLKEGRPVSL